jgi:glucose-1-phosphate thymidylyltransferase
MVMRGIVLAGGAGTRLHPLTRAVSKQLLPIHDKPMIYYPLSVLMLAGIRDILIISTPHDLPQFRRLLGEGERFGVRFQYAEQPRPEGLAQAFLLGRDFLAGEPACLILGDNVFYGHGFIEQVRGGAQVVDGAKIFAYWVRDPERFGVVEFDGAMRAVSLEEKPVKPRSHYAIPGLYFYGPDVCELVARLKPSARGELEITDLHRLYLEQRRLEVEVIGRGIAWLDTGTFESLNAATGFVHAIEARQGLKVACLEEIAWRNGWIDLASLRREAESMGKSDYAAYLHDLLLQAERQLPPRAAR